MELKFLISCILFIIILFHIYFNRGIPQHMIPSKQPDLVLQPCDGKLVNISTTYHNDQPYYTLQWFLSLTDIHSQYLPISGQILRIINHQGDFSPATDSIQVLDNSRIETWIQPNSKSNIQSNIQSELNPSVIIEQIAGILTQSITNDLQPNNIYPQTTKMGHIYLGSTVRLHLPKSHYRLHDLQIQRKYPIFHPIATKVTKVTKV